MTKDLEKRYLNWLTDLVSFNRMHEGKCYRKLLTYLYERSFNYILPMDGNRSEDGIDLRYSGFGYSCHVEQYEIERYLDRRDCSVLEMMISLAIRAEGIVGDSEVGDRVPKWFWAMVRNLGLIEMDDIHYDEVETEWKIDRFMDREYEEDGNGGLFIVKDPPYDIRNAEIWNQMCWFLSENA